MANNDFIGKLVKGIERKKAQEAAKAFQGGGWRGGVKPRSPRPSGGDGGPNPFLKALRSVMRTANCLLNAEEGKRERFLRCVYADGKRSNKLNDADIVLSPDVISRETTLKPEWSFDERVDVLGADALILSTMKRTADSRAHDKVKGSKFANKLWYTMETLNAEREILSEFPGAAEDFGALRSYYSDPKASGAIEGRIAMATALGQPDPEGAMAALQFEMTYPDQKLDLPPQYRDAIDWAKEQIDDDCETSLDRAEQSLGIEREFLKRFPPPPSSGKSGGGSSGGGAKGDGKGGGKGKGKKEESGEGGGGGGKPDKDEGDEEGDEKEEGEGEGEGEDEKDSDKEGEDEKEGEGKGDKEEEPKELPELPNIGQARDTLDENVENESQPEVQEIEVSSTDNLDEKTPARVLLTEDANDFKGGHKEAFPQSPDYMPAYRSILSKVRGKAMALRNKIKIQNEEQSIMHHGLKSGLLDEGSLHKIGIDRQDEALFEAKEIPSKPKLAFGILVDESGSMSCNNRYMKAREIAIILANAVKGYEGLDLAVMGHTTTCGGGWGEQLLMTHYYTPEHHQIEAMAGICACANNLDGYAMRFMALKMAQWYPDHAQRCLFVISDGLPCANSYGGPSAHRHMLEVCYRARKMWGVDIFGLGIDNAFPHSVGCEMYGEGKFVVLQNTMTALNVIGQYITKAVRKANMLK